MAPLAASEAFKAEVEQLLHGLKLAVHEIDDDPLEAKRMMVALVNRVDYVLSHTNFTS